MNSSQKSKNSQNYSTLEEFTSALQRALGNLGITVTQKTELQEPTNKYSVKFLSLEKKSLAEKLQQICKKCSHSKADHYNMVLNPVNNSKAKSGNCRRDDCNCKKFEQRVD